MSLIKLNISYRHVDITFAHFCTYLGTIKNAEALISVNGLCKLMDLEFFRELKMQIMFDGDYFHFFRQMHCLIIISHLHPRLTSTFKKVAHDNLTLHNSQ